MASTTNRAKFVMLGKSYVGKSSLVLRLVQNSFREYLPPTQADYYTCKRRVGDRDIQFDLWDTAGQERFKSLLPMYTRDASVAIVVFDVSDALSLESAFTWLEEYCQQVPIIALVANKIDLLANPDPRTDPLLKLAFEKSEAIKCNFFMVSAKRGDGVAKMFDSLALAAANYHAAPEDPKVDENSKSTSTTSSTPSKNSSRTKANRYDRVELVLQTQATTAKSSCSSCWNGATSISWWSSKDSNAQSDNPTSSNAPAEDKELNRLEPVEE